ncbi:type II toxin-antitoxin system RelE/ParE family toxin (plasmid) [Tistrella mobilis]|uniref:Addiction module toxin RelE n=1 Tax=Tistrella mobilis TaxID=171437 RepID=A0A162L4J5_9PROT|nr:type II toxin-antitoxin system RelE/ParE family toxin [Tistrella mobilis]KYO53241.1 addiction module toxin RelE [Tistrella mobilis]
MKVIWTEAADHDREAVLDLIAEEDLQAALRMDELFTNAARRLSAFPGMGRPGRMAGTRELLPHRSYRLIYRQNDDLVIILAIIHTARHWPVEAPRPDV